MSQHIIDLEALGMIGDTASGANQGTHDCAGVWNANVPNAAPGSTILLPPNYCAFKSKPAALPSTCKLQGSGEGSHLVRCFSQSASDIFLTMGAIDCTVEDVRLWAADGTSGGIAIGRIATNALDAPFHPVIEGLETTRFTSGRWHGGIAFDGERGQVMYGARRIHMNDIILSGMDEAANSGSTGIYLAGVNEVSGSNIYVAGSMAQWGIWIHGIPGVNPSALINLTGPIGGTVLMYSTLTCRITASALDSVILDNNCVSNRIDTVFLNRTPPQVGGQNNRVSALVGGKEVSWSSPG